MTGKACLSSNDTVTQQLVMVSPVRLCIRVCFLEMRNDTNNLPLVLSTVVVAADQLVRGLRKLPEDIDWSYSGLYEPFAV